jgi:amino acid adenylation domain-containing protein
MESQRALEDLMVKFQDNADNAAPVLLTDAERQLLLVDWNNTAAVYPRYECVHELVEAQVERTPDTVAVIHGARQLTFRELNLRANQLARYLKRRGVGPDITVGIGLERSLELAVTMLGVLKAGGACMPLDPNYPAERLLFMQSDAQAPVLLTQPGLLAKFAGSRADVICVTPDWGPIAGEREENLPHAATPETTAYVIYTSGSTGTPRGVLLTHGGLVNHHTAAVKLYGLTSADRVLQFSSISFDIAIEEIWPAWISGATVVLRTEDMPLDGSGFLRWIEQHSVTVLDLPTAYWHECTHQITGLKHPLPACLRLVVVGGEQASAAVLQSWFQISRGHVRWINTYGPSETSVIATAYEPSATDIMAEVPIGRPIANTQVYVLDSNLQPVPIGVSGELYIGGIGVAAGYLKRPELTAEKFITDPFRPGAGTRLYKTGDLARYRPDGNLEFRGRRDHQVKIRGFRVELGEIEAALRLHAGVREAVVVFRADGPSGNGCLVAYIVPTTAPAPDINELRDFLKKKLPEYMLPASFLMLKAMPLSPNGKIDRNALPEPPEEPQDSAERGAALPENLAESKLLKIWQELLRTRPIGVRDNFFDLGGNSLLAIRMMHRIERTFGRTLPLTVLLQAPTIVSLADVLDQKLRTEPSPCLVALQPLGLRPPFFCVHGLGGAVLRFRALAQHMGPDQPLYALQALGLDGDQPCLTRVEEMAIRYIAEIRRVQSSGPYYLGGYSFGGLVALEMARQLSQDGEDIGLLAMLDSFPGKPQSRASLLIKFLRMSPIEQVPYFLRKARKKIKRTIAGVSLPAPVKNVRRACYMAEVSYHPEPYPGQVTLFLPSQKSLRSWDDPQGGWGAVALGGVEVQHVPGDHGSIVDEPNVRLLAEPLLVCLERAQAAAGPRQTRLCDSAPLVRA